MLTSPSETQARLEALLAKIPPVPKRKFATQEELTKERNRRGRAEDKIAIKFFCAGKNRRQKKVIVAYFKVFAEFRESPDYPKIVKNAKLMYPIRLVGTCTHGRGPQKNKNRRTSKDLKQIPTCPWYNDKSSLVPVK